MFPIVPLQVLVGCLDSLGGSTSRLLEPLNPRSRCPLAPVPLFTWLSTIGKRLDHSWIDQTAVSAKVAKNDAALVATHMWDQRILLPLPTLTGGLPYLRSQLMRFQRSRLYWEFRSHMVATHGADWSAQLTLLRSQLRPTIQKLRRNDGALQGNKGGKVKKVKNENQEKSKETLKGEDPKPEVPSQYQFFPQGERRWFAPPPPQKRNC
jgi:hypothetical protein